MVSPISANDGNPLVQRIQGLDTLLRDDGVVLEVEPDFFSAPARPRDIAHELESEQVAGLDFKMGTARAVGSDGKTDLNLAVSRIARARKVDVTSVLLGCLRCSPCFDRRT